MESSDSRSKHQMSDLKAQVRTLFSEPLAAIFLAVILGYLAGVILGFFKRPSRRE